MDANTREFMDKDRTVVREFDEIDEKFEQVYETVISQLEKLIKADPDYFDIYLLLYRLFKFQGNYLDARKTLDKAYKRAIKLITDENGNWPDVLMWGWMDNRHIIRTIATKATFLWEEGKFIEALELFRKLLKTNPSDNIGARHLILAIRMGISPSEFNRRFDKGGYSDRTLDVWFDKNSVKFPDEFDWWHKYVETNL